MLWNLVKVFVNVGKPLTKPDDAKRSVVVAAFKFGIILLEFRKSKGLGIICKLCALSEDVFKKLSIVIVLTKCKSPRPVLALISSCRLPCM